jgi:formylglycine-generating enzyme required for sulfatase activity
MTPKQPWVNGASGLVNRCGLSELHGQLFEWCEDTWHPNPMGKGRPEDGQPWLDADADLTRDQSGQSRWKVLRGGAWLGNTRIARAAFRSCDFPDVVATYCGLRPCCPFLPPYLLGS